MGKVFDLDPAGLSPAERVDALLASERELARVQARQLRLLAVMAAEPFPGEPAAELDRQWVKEDVRAALGVSAVWASSQLAFAQTLVHRLPSTLEALEAGRISVRHARYLHDAVVGLSDEDAVRVEAAALSSVERRRELTAFRRTVRRALLRLTPSAIRQRLGAAASERRVWQVNGEYGMATVSALLPAPDAVAIRAALDVRAHAYGPGDPRTMDQRRADALRELVHAGLAALTGTGCEHCGEPGSSGGGAAGPAVQVTVALSTLLGLDEEPAELGGYGPVPAVLARRIAADPTGTWRRLVTDAMGRLIDYGRTRYRPPSDLHEFVVARDRECLFPTCHRPACRCELDHAIAWADGGPTNADNLTALCCRHHHGKHNAGWQLHRLPDGGIEWTSRTGHKYTVPANTYPIDTTMREAFAPPNEAEHPPTETDADPPEAA